MRRFIIKFGLILLPVVLMSAILAGLAWHTGEALPIQDVVTIQQADPDVIYGTKKLENIMPLKLLTYQARQPDILILGSSRLLQVRDQFFSKQPDAVYNASGGGWQLGTMIQYYHLIDPESRPDIIILGIDQTWFNADLETNLVREQTPDTTYHPDTLRSASVAVMQSLLSRDLSISDLMRRTDTVYHRRVLGLTALENSFGYRADGSLQQGLLIANRTMQNASLGEHISNFQTSTAYNYMDGDTVNTNTVRRLEEFLDELTADGITVIGLTIPYHYQIYDMMQETDDYSYIDKAIPMLEALFEQRDYPYYYFADVRDLGAQYDDWYDGWHVTESNTLRMLQVIFEDHPDLFADYTDTTYIKQLLDSFTNPMDVLGDLPE